MDATTPGLYIPPVPKPPEAPLPMREFLRAIRQNALTMWPEAAYRDAFMVRQFFGRKNFLLNAPDAIHHVLVDNHANYRRSAASIRILRPITGDGLLLSLGDAWRLQRRTVAPALGPRVIPLLCDHILASAREALDALDATAPLDLLAFMQSLALDIAGRSMFSLETKQYGPAMRALLDEFAERFAQPHLLDMVLPPSIPTLRDWRRARFSKRWMHLIETMMRQRKTSPVEVAEKPRDLFDLLTSARDPETGAGFSPAELRDQVATLILAGHETTAVTLYWALVLLARAEGFQQWMADELSGIDLTDEGALAGLVRTRAVVNETLRLFPAAFTIVRETIAPDQVGSLHLPARSVVMIAPWVLHRHHALWTEPGAFNPARFMPDAPVPARFAFLPFGAGPRICVGAQFAMAEAVLVLASLVQRFHITLDDPRPIMPMAVVTTQPDHAPLFRLTPRQS